MASIAELQLQKNMAIQACCTWSDAHNGRTIIRNQHQLCCVASKTSKYTTCKTWSGPHNACTIIRNQHQLGNVASKTAMQVV